MHIGSHCWVGSNVVILKGVTIGDNCVIGAGCVITEDIPSNSIVTMDRKLLIKSIKSS
ncbi:DapH/DapD/GlmU-related protein [Phascolarctobacterium sp.]